MRNKFKVGDLVVAKCNCYTFTNELAICKVVEIKNEKFMDVKIVDLIDKRKFYEIVGELFTSEDIEGLLKEKFLVDLLDFKLYEVGDWD